MNVNEELKFLGKLKKKKQFFLGGIVGGGMGVGSSGGPERDGGQGGCE